jgi:hypothetical protein
LTFSASSALYRSTPLSPCAIVRQTYHLVMRLPLDSPYIAPEAGSSLLPYFAFMYMRRVGPVC